MSKADRIWALLQAGKSVQEIARLIGCQEPYVRAVKQRKTSTDNAYTRYEDRIRKIAQKYGDKEAASRASSKAYREYLSRGMSRLKAKSMAGSIYRLTLRKTALANIPPVT